MRVGRGDCRPVYIRTTPPLLPTHHPWLQQDNTNTQVNVSKNWFSFCLGVEELRNSRHFAVSKPPTMLNISVHNVT